VFEIIEESAFAYVSHYHPRMKYSKESMIARGDDACHGVFVWE
jgi:predicted metal-binding transcription factor (methanogenesis marker protein 9)